MLCGHPTHFGGKARGTGWGGEEEKRGEIFSAVFRWSSNVHNFLRVCSLPSWQMLQKKPVQFQRKANLSREGEGEGGSPSTQWRDDINLDSMPPLACCSLKDCMLTLPGRTVLGETSFRCAFSCHMVKYVFKLNIRMSQTGPGTVA